MKRLLAVLVMLATSVLAQSQFYNATVSVTGSNTAVIFSDNGSGGTGRQLVARRVLVRSASDSAATCYFDLKDTVATASDTALEPGAGIVLEFDVSSAAPGQDGWSGMGAICSGGTATFYVTATR